MSTTYYDGANAKVVASVNFGGSVSSKLGVGSVPACVAVHPTVVTCYICYYLNVI